jgi:dTDP-4-dehydrorhamnose reductase
VDRAETRRRGLLRGERDGATESLSLAAHDVGAHLIAISTDYVFDGNEGQRVRRGGRRPTRSTCTARRSARAELLCAGDDTIVRTSWVMGVRGKNVLHAIAQRAAVGRDGALRQ